MVRQVDGRCSCSGDNERAIKHDKDASESQIRVSDFLRAQRNDRMTSNLKRWIENGAPDKRDLEEDSYKILKQFYLKRKDLLYLIKDGIVACELKEEDKVLYKYNSNVLPQ